MNSEKIYQIAKLNMEEQKSGLHLANLPTKTYFECMTAFDPAFSIFMPCRIVSAAHYEYAENFFLTSQNIEMYDILYLYKGSLRMISNEKQWQVKPNEILFLNAKMQYEIKQENSSTVEIFLMRNHGFLCMSYYQLMMKEGFHPIPIKNSVLFHTLFDRIHFYMRYPTNSNNALVTNAITQIYTELYMNATGFVMNDTLYGHPKWFLDTIAYIEKNYAKSIKVEQIALHTGLSESYFYSIFKEYTGNSPYQYLNTVRVNHAKTLLVTTDLQIKYIAPTIGFTTVSHFIEQFKKATGVTPVQFRKERKKE